jgi:MarR family 2-MHQ and catechol resistance regulon transcriptional repressor
MNKEQIPGIIIGKLMNLGGMLQRQGNKMLLPFNLNQQQFSIFFEIAKAGKVKQKEMVNRLLLEKAHVSKVVKKLQQMDLITVTENDEDKRSYWLSVTKKGGELLKQCSEMFHEWHKNWICEIDETELSSILDHLTTLQNIFREKTR